MVVFATRLFQLQVIEHDKYIELASSEQQKRLVIPAARGQIYALDSGIPVPLALNQTVYTVFADPSIIRNPDKTQAILERIIGGNLQPDVSQLLSAKQTQYKVLAKKVSETQATLLKKENLNGIGFQAESERVYPEGALASQTLGYVDYDGVGRYGVEGALNDQFKGKDGTLQAVTDVANVPLSIGKSNVNTPAKNGTDVVLSLDRNVQAHTETALANGLKRTGATNGSVIVMEPSSGKVMAMANMPTFNPSKLNDVKNVADFNNGTISAPYEAGSVIKTLTLATGIDKNVIRPDSTYNNTDYIQVEDRTISNATKGQTGVITMQHALNYSLNTGMVTVAERLGDGKNINRTARDTMYDYFHNKFGLGEKTGIELDGENSGTVVPPTDPGGNAVRYSNMAFGQGMDVTMVQVCAAFSTIINGGVYYKPTVIAGSVDENGTYVPRTISAEKSGVIRPETSQQVKEMIYIARQKFYGSADNPGFYVGGKTGTSQTIENGVYVDNQTIGTYIGYGATKDEVPKYVIMVTVSGKNMNLGGNTDAMPIFTDISNWMLDYMKLAPKA